MFRVKRFAAAIDMMAAGTRAPMATAAYATPANQLGNMAWKSSGAARRLLVVWMPAAMAMKPRSAMNASISEYSGRKMVLRLMVSRCFEASTPVTECGYMKSAIAEPSASVAYAQYDFADGKRANVDGTCFAAAAAATVLAWLSTAAKILS